MYKCEWNILEKLEPMLTGAELKARLKVLPDYAENITLESQAVRLMALNNLHSFYLPSDMSVEIYTKLYLAMVRSMQKKESRLATLQRNANSRNIRACAKGEEPSFGGIIGGSDSFSIIGCSGIGKSTAIAKAIALFGGEKVITMEHPYCKMVPVINVQCPFDCSAKSMLLAILQKVDQALGTSYYENTVRAKANINTMLISTAQILLNHVSVVCIDEIQNLIKHRAGMQLVSMLTELLNESGISIVFIGTPEIEPFFESVDYLARRTLGLHYDKCSYDNYFRNFCNELWKFQYVRNKTEISDSIIHWLYEHSSGTLAHVIFLFYTAQEISILDERETTDIPALEAAYQRMGMLHTHIQPDLNFRKTAPKKKKNSSMAIHQETKPLTKENGDRAAITEESIIQHPTENKQIESWSFMDFAEQAKKGHSDMLELLKGKISITEIAI